MTSNHPALFQQRLQRLVVVANCELLAGEALKAPQTIKTIATAVGFYVRIRWKGPIAKDTVAHALSAEMGKLRWG